MLICAGIRRGILPPLEGAVCFRLINIPCVKNNHDESYAFLTKGILDHDK